jgi:hypothetical protein
MLIAENRCAALFVSTVSPDSVTDDTALWAPGVDVPPFHPSGYMDKAPGGRGRWCYVSRARLGSARALIPAARSSVSAEMRITR